MFKANCLGSGAQLQRLLKFLQEYISRYGDSYPIVSHDSISPGLVLPVAIENHRLLAFGDEVVLEPAACTIAVDGERQLEVFVEQTVSVQLSGDGPRVVDVRQCLLEASERGVLRDPDVLAAAGTTI